MLISARGPALYVQTGLQLSLIVHSEPPQPRNEFRLVSLEVGVVKALILLAVQVVLRVGLLEPVQIELTDKTGEVGGFEGVGAARGDGTWRQDLLLEQLLVNDDYLALAVPADGVVGRVVHQTPQLSRKIAGVD